MTNPQISTDTADTIMVALTVMGGIFTGPSRNLGKYDLGKHDPVSSIRTASRPRSRSNAPAWTPAC